MVYSFQKEIDGIVYHAEFKGIAFSLYLDELIENGISKTKLAEILFKEVLVSPKVSIDDFADIKSFYKVFKFLSDVALGINGKRQSKAKLERKVKENWAYWRLVLSERGFDFQTVFGKPFMTPQDVREANIALDMQIEADKKAAKKK